MAVVILDPLPDLSGVSMSASSQVADARYNFLANSILSSFGENGGISLVVADSSVQSGLLRETLEQIYDGLRVFEVPCRRAIANVQIIPSLPQFISVDFSVSRPLANPGPLGAAIDARHAPMLFICDGAEGLEDEQLETMYRLSCGKQGPLGVVLLATPEFLLRLQNSRLDHIRAALSACFWSQHSAYGAAVYADDRQNRIVGFMPFNLAQLPAPLLERLTIQNGEADGGGRGSSTTRKVRALLGRIGGRYRRRAITVAFSVGYLLIAGGTACVQSWMSGHPQGAVAGGETPASLPLTASVAWAPKGADSASVEPSSGFTATIGRKDVPVAPVIAESADTPAPSAPIADEEQAHNELATLAPVGNSALTRAAPAPAPPKSAAAVSEMKLSVADQALFAQRGNELLATGDIASARLFFERAANAGDAGSAVGMAKTFDPNELAKAGARGVKGDAAKADYWYQRARLLAGNRNSGNQVKENLRD